MDDVVLGVGSLWMMAYGCGWRINFVAISDDVEYNSSSLIEGQ
jgi:hypothetical protein